MSVCQSTYLGRQCEREAGHPVGATAYADDTHSAGIWFWTDAAADSAPDHTNRSER